MFRLLSNKKSLSILTSLSIGLIGLTYNNCGSDEDAKTVSSNVSSTDSGNCSSFTPLELSIPFKEEDQYDENDNLLIGLDHSYTNDLYMEAIDHCNSLVVDSTEYIDLDCANLKNENGYPYKSHYGWHYDPTNFYIENPKYTHSDGQPIFPYYAMSDGCVTRVQIDNPVGEDYVDSNVSVLVSYGDVTVVYLFEPQATVDQVDEYENLTYAQNTQLGLINVTAGQTISKGDLIGHLYTPENRDFAPTMHFHVSADEILCPAQYFATEDLTKTQSLLREVFPLRELCYD